MAYRFLHHGDAIGFTGKRAAMFPLPAVAIGLAMAHGMVLAPGADLGDGLIAPTEREPIAAFISRPAEKLH